MNRPNEITEHFILELEKHLQALKDGKAESTFEIGDIASLLYIHPVHLSNTIKQVLGKSPCDMYEEKLMEIAKEMILTTTVPIAEIARRLTFDPSNFSKFFKHFEGITPKQFRDAHQ